MVSRLKYLLKKNINGKTSYVVIITIVSLFLVVGGVSVAIYTSQMESLGSLNIVVGNLASLLESTDFVDGTKVEVDAHSEKVVHLSFNNSNTINIKYNLYYKEVEGVEVGYINNGNLPPKEEGLIIKKGEMKEYTVKLKNNTGDYQVIEFGSDMGLASKNLEFPKNKKILLPFIYSEEILNGADPVLGSKMIPVVLSDNGAVRYADLSDEWYKYQDKKWANAVLLVDKPSENYTINDTILEQDIESYFVWIPRYKYQLFDMGEYTSTPDIDRLPDSVVKSIQIEFQNKDDPKETKEELGKYYTHPAFTLGTKELSGIWVGKFETGYNQTGDGSSPINTDGWTEVNARKDVDVIESKRIIVKPNVYSWRSLTIYKIFMNGYNYQRNLDSHLLKNTEWGAVVYLSYSQYGIDKEVNINNNSGYLTGYSATEGANQSISPGEVGVGTDKTLPYNTPTGYKASTTGNITGIYDMSGGVWEYLAAYMAEHGLTSTSTGEASGFQEEDLVNYADYFDVYAADSHYRSYNNRILGDATGEMGPFYNYADNTGKYLASSWYNDNSQFVVSGFPWYVRGGTSNSGSRGGIICFSQDSGGARVHGFRLALTGVS